MMGYQAHNLKVIGSPYRGPNPPHIVDLLTITLSAVGSSPCGGTIKINDLAGLCEELIGSWVPYGFQNIASTGKFKVIICPAKVD